ncbi:c-type cytochrome [Rubritalea marina]|uniref:c-type cytochrome n=1 Tax=Rubritalea marina TaxID=361055 RepID=UPI0003660A3C|nr:cytochrome c [Rubritalea marina]
MSSDQTPVDPTKPDLEESTNVAKAHEEVTRNAAAVSREQQLRENGLEPVSTWIMIAGFIVAVIGGGVLFSSDSFFNYEQSVKPNYVRAQFDDGKAAIPMALAADAYMKKGAALYKNCASCHGPGGAGNGAVFPPLAGSEWVEGSGVVPALTIIHGLNGQIKVAGATYNGAMPAMADGWSDFDVAALIYYIQNSFGNKVGQIYSLDQIAEIRAISKEFGKKPMTASDLEKYLAHKFEAADLPSETMLNLKTGEVVDANN